MATINPLAKISPNHIKETAPTTNTETEANSFERATWPFSLACCNLRGVASSVLSCPSDSAKSAS
ncbi:Uncharacterised protein [Vibrio cholerae]|nr:Uncharacterised protein [Vibrio cholerae]